MKGLGVLLNELGGNSSTIEALKKVLGEKIIKCELKEDELLLHFKTTTLVLWDAGQSCCEHRYMSTDDDLKYFKNTIFKDIEIKPAPSIDDNGESHDVEFLEIHTGKGSFVMQNHNEHNGYYGGFSICAKLKN